MSIISDQTINAVKSTNILTVAKVLGCNIKKHGKNSFRTNCIHPGDNDPSLILYMGTNTFNCFGCHRGGDVIDLVSYFKNFSFAESVEYIANIIGMEVAYKDKKSEESILQKELKKYCSDIKEIHILDFLTSRNVDQKDIKEWKLGYIKEVNRLVIPIYMLNHLRGFAYRNFINKPKYFYDVRNEHSVSTGLVYGFDKARSIRNSLLQDTCVLVEGYFDAIQLNKYDVPAVALMGCTLTAEQMKVLKKAFKHFVVFMDGDPAGEAATRNISASLPYSEAVYFNGDPDELAISLKHDTAQYIADNKISVAAHDINKLLSQANASIDTVKLKTLSAIKPLFESISQEEQEYYADIVSKQLGINKNFFERKKDIEK